MEVDKVYLGDCISIMKTFPCDSVDLIFADPPFNIGIKYDVHNDNMPYEEYYQWSIQWISECYRLLKKKWKYLHCHRRRICRRNKCHI